ncbi:SDR family oxidoreductase [Sphingosinithalassobacter sp. CS137]|uniref:SDR family oxidoreductase n=1 Tax=Sphingosinithalassobacter sp. CS137 TaxID=2762748 RepID=UPI00165D3C6F|nr:SDR family oxidoreductase [Sphingosinithalassobacter sp. CS137]
MSIILKPLEQQTIVITGATSGNGLATVREAARRGASLVLAARNAEALEEIADELRATGARVATCKADVASDEDIERIAQTAIEAFGGFDTWVNDAAAAMYGRMDEIPMEDHRRVFDVNYFGVLKGSLVAADHLREKGGAIINLGSVLSDRAMILQGAYSATKHAVKAATDALRMELQRDGVPISVTLIKPAAMHTPYPEHARNYMNEPARLPPILYDPRLVAEAILFAAEHSKRQLYVGGNGYLISLGGRFAKRATDAAMKALGRRLQTDEHQPAPPATKDNLYEPRQDGSIDGHQDYYVRRTSLLLEAQKQPALTLLTAAAGLGLLLLPRWGRAS